MIQLRDLMESSTGINASASNRTNMRLSMLIFFLWYHRHPSSDSSLTRQSQVSLSDSDYSTLKARLCFLHLHMKATLMGLSMLLPRLRLFTDQKAKIHNKLHINFPSNSSMLAQPRVSTSWMTFVPSSTWDSLLSHLTLLLRPLNAKMNNICKDTRTTKSHGPSQVWQGLSHRRYLFTAMTRPCTSTRMEARQTILHSLSIKLPFVTQVMRWQSSVRTHSVRFKCRCVSSMIELVVLYRCTELHHLRVTSIRLRLSASKMIWPPSSRSQESRLACTRLRLLFQKQPSSLPTSTKPASISTLSSSMFQEHMVKMLSMMDSTILSQLDHWVRRSCGRLTRK